MFWYWPWLQSMMTSSKRNIFRVTGPLWGESTGHRWISHKSQWCRTVMFCLICTWTNGWANNRGACDLRRHCAHYDVIVMFLPFISTGRYGSNFKSIISERIMRIKFTNTSKECSQVNANEHLWWEVNNGSGNGLVSLDKLLPEPMLTQSLSPYGDIKPQWFSTCGHYSCNL